MSHCYLELVSTDGIKSGLPSKRVGPESLVFQRHHGIFWILRDRDLDLQRRSNGVVERSVQSVEGPIRTLMSACQERTGTRIKLEEKIVIFMAEYAAYLINRLEVGKDSKTAYERCRGKTSNSLGH